ncbi:serine hydrolase domain-containing protein [Subtercola sp. YIM 133946]|uniref:serine hydrolase domain-containing protein n=1 Tax=Subtercola sp. YIM 133946 TaxID=3118909 RepID=UPI002F9337D4
MPNPLIEHGRPRLRALRIASAGAVLALAAVATGCTSSAQPAPSSTPGPTSTAAATPALPADAAALTATFQNAAKSLMVPGAAMLIRTPDGDITATYGTTELGGTTPVSLDDHIRVGSNTKTWTGTVILQLAQEGRLALTDPVSKYRPDVPNGDNITIEELLNMRSGLFNYTETYQLNHDLDVDPGKVWNPEELVAMGLALPPYFAPGTGFHYSNTNTVLLGLIAQQLDGKPLQQIFQDRLFTPLGLTNTSFPASDDASIPAPYSNGYMYTDNVQTLATATLPADLLAQAQAGTLLPNDFTATNPSWAWSAGAGISTIGDLATWVEALGGGTGDLLNADMQQQRMQSVIGVPNSAGGAGYGWGIARMGPIFYGHTGELPGYNSYMGYDPVNKVTMVVWTNLAPSADGRPPAATLAADLIGELYGTATATPTPGSGSGSDDTE